MASRIEPELKTAIDASLKAYASGDRKFFDYLADDVRVYGVTSAEPIIGRKEFEAAFGSNFQKFKREVKVVTEDVQAGPQEAILAQTLEITTEGVTSFVRQTVVWRNAAHAWKIVHIHNAFVAQPIHTGATPNTAAALRVLNERIATAAAAVGVAQ